MKNVVIAGSAQLQEKINMWVRYWNDKDGYSVLDYPKVISGNNFTQLYPNIHRAFYENITKADVFFVANEEKVGVEGYVGAETFAELAFAVAQKIVYKKKINIILAHYPSESVHSSDEINLWLALGWIDGVLDKSNRLLVGSGD